MRLYSCLTVFHSNLDVNEQKRKSSNFQCQQSDYLQTTLLYCCIRSARDHTLLQNDLHELEKWATNWGMKFNAKTYYAMSINQKSSTFYQLDNHILEHVEENPYL